MTIRPDDTGEDQASYPKPELLWDDDLFRERVRQAAKRKGISVAELARRIGASPTWLQHSAIKTGRGIENILQAAVVLGIDPSELITGQQRPAKRAEENRESDTRRRLLATVTTVAAHLVVALQSADDKDAIRIFQVMLRAILQILDESASKDSGSTA